VVNYSLVGLDWGRSGDLSKDFEDGVHGFSFEVLFFGVGEVCRYLS